MKTPFAWHEQLYHIPVSKEITIEGNLNIPQQPQGVIVFAHGSGSNRHSPREQYVARVLHDAGFATLLINLLAPQEEPEDRKSGYLRFSVDWLSERVISATAWLKEHLETKSLPVGYFGGSLGGPVVLVAAARCPFAVNAVISRGGDPALARSALRDVQAPTLFLVGSRDREILTANRMGVSSLTCEKHIEVVEGATHLFEEPGALEQVAQFACQWFVRYFPDDSLEDKTQ